MTNGHLEQGSGRNRGREGRGDENWKPANIYVSDQRKPRGNRGDRILNSWRTKNGEVEKGDKSMLLNPPFYGKEPTVNQVSAYFSTK